MITEVKDQDLAAAGYIHSKAWKESHKSICSAEFVETHTPQAQMEYLRGQLEAGKTVYMLVEEEPVGIVSVHGNVIENLYVLPEKQNRGFGTAGMIFCVQAQTSERTSWGTLRKEVCPNCCMYGKMLRL